MKIKALLRGLKGIEVKGSKEVEITGLTEDSRTAGPGSLFIARKGDSFNGAEFIDRALQAGAVAVLTDLYDPFCKATQIIAEKPELLEPFLANRFYGAPSEEMFIVGVTGTKGKTTTTYLIHHLLNGLGKRAALVGTVETVIGEERRASTLTTHTAIQNQKLLKEMRGKGCEAVSFEVSSHGLEQRRVENIDFDVGIFTNLYSDHLDYHPTMQAYAAAKKKLFANIKRAIFNADNEWTPFMREGCKSPIWTFGIEKEADIRAEHIQFDEQGTTFFVDQQRFQISLMGRFNVYNALGAIAVGLHLGASLAQIAAILASFQTAPGRLERVLNDKGIWVFVDYAHTGEALESVLLALREIARRRVICVFGCGGNRDPQRRTRMAQAAEKHADAAIITSDNPRNEDPIAICEQIRSAYRDPAKPIVEVNRKEAIFRAIQMAEPEDIVLIAGKGHEKVQKFAHHTIPFDDVAVAMEALLKNSNGI
jgi:UDP-N-acetylmuramoyl-L-alanyl-D-glutamate--2,6-diaminopimelate ligase